MHVNEFNEENFSQKVIYFAAFIHWLLVKVEIFVDRRKSQETGVLRFSSKDPLIAESNLPSSRHTKKRERERMRE